MTQRLKVLCRFGIANLLTLAAMCVAAGLVAQEPAGGVNALRAPRVLKEPGDKYADDARLWQGIPGIERAENGRLWATWYSGGPTEGKWNYVLLYTSGDDGRSWKQTLVIDPQGDVRAFDPCLWIDPVGRLWLFWAQGIGGDQDPPGVGNIWDGRAGVWAIVADDPGKAQPQWSAPRRLCNGIMMNKPTVSSTGAWLLPAAVWRVVPSPDTRKYRLFEELGANVVGSRDTGATWTRYGGAQVADSAFDEHMVVERQDGSLWMLLRTTRGIGESISHDGGRTWSEGRSTALAPLPSARFFLRRLKSGNLLLVRHDPPNKKSRSHLKAFLSKDDGATWNQGLMVDVRSGVSYPDAVETEEGQIYLIYDYDRRGAREILMAVFREQDVAAGKIISDDARMRVLVNKATGKK